MNREIDIHTVEPNCVTPKDNSIYRSTNAFVVAVMDCQAQHIIIHCNERFLLLISLLRSHYNNSKHNFEFETNRSQ